MPDVLGEVADGRVIVCHLGNGCSLTGMIRRRSVYTTMGFTPLDGLMMGCRPGRLDPVRSFGLLTTAAAILPKSIGS